MISLACGQDEFLGRVVEPEDGAAAEAQALMECRGDYACRCISILRGVKLAADLTANGE